MLSILRKAFRSEPTEQSGQEGFYQPKGRCAHSSVLINKDIFVWGGLQHRLPKVHMSDLKLQMTTVVEVFRGGEGRWQPHYTTGIPPLGVIGCASCAIGHKIYYFGGWCNHDQCTHNSLHELDTNNFEWTVCLANSDNGPMKKNYCEMVAFHQALLVVGGVGYSPENLQPLADYDGNSLPVGQICTNEHHIYVLGTVKWSSPTISGNKPPPVYGFTLSKFADDKALMFGGQSPHGCLSDLRVAIVTGNNVHWEMLVPHGPEKPRGRRLHATTIIHSPLKGDQQTLLLVAGGTGVIDTWLLSVSDGASWREIKNVPTSVSGRAEHSMNTIAASHSSVWLMALGGYPLASSIVTFMELNLSPSGLWEMGNILAGDKSSLKLSDHSQMESHAAAELEAGRSREAQLVHQLHYSHTQIEAMRRDIQIKDQQLYFAQQQLEAVKRDVQIKDEQLQLAEQQQIQYVSTLTEKDQQIQIRNQQIQDKDQQLQEKAKEIQEKIEQIEEREHMLQHSKLQLQYKNVQQQQQNQQIQQKDQKIWEKDQQLQCLQQQVKAVRRDVQIKDQQLQFAQQQLQENDHQLQQLNQLIQRKDQQIQEKEQRLLYFQHQLQEKNQQMQRKDQQIQEKDQHLQLAQQQVKEVKRDVQMKDHQLQLAEQNVS